MWSFLLDDVETRRFEIEKKVMEVFDEPFDPDEAEEYKRELWAQKHMEENGNLESSPFFVGEA